MATVKLIEYAEASPEVRAVYDDIMATRKADLAVSASDGCHYGIASHTASARRAGMTNEMLGELLAVVGMANQTNRLADGHQIEIDEMFKTAG